MIIVILLHPKILSIFYHSKLKLQQESKHVFFPVNLLQSSLFSSSAEEILKEGKAYTLPQFKGSFFDDEKRSQSLKGEKMKMMNLKLYLKNKCIMVENMMLRKKTLLLSQENKALLSNLQASNKSNGKFL
ncbi:hypothetical protein KFK09_018419 [Dendrobium nobile]|uniref:Uncharacterized protein n=1 Tax=Dendrobium nobile TaxID=94219 RepID=A0A8T3AVQ4_DENNO|nr:hypothetical protein KFK09_018419 [Dendrobium nobile]